MPWCFVAQDGRPDSAIAPPVLRKSCHSGVDSVGRHGPCGRVHSRKTTATRNAKWDASSHPLYPIFGINSKFIYYRLPRGAASLLGRSTLCDFGKIYAHSSASPWVAVLCLLHVVCQNNSRSDNTSGDFPDTGRQNQEKGIGLRRAR